MGSLMNQAISTTETTTHTALKMGIYGSQGTGKTTLAMSVAIGLVNKFGLKKPIAMADTEKGSLFWRDIVKKKTGMPLAALGTSNFDQLCAFAREAERDASVLIVDSASAFWRELTDALKRHLRVEKLQPHNYVPIKSKWFDGFTSWMLNTNLHVIVCGRAGANFTDQETEDGSRIEMVADGTKMKAEGDFGYEFELLVEMQQHVLNKRGKKGKGGNLALQAFVRKDRWRDLNGSVITFPANVPLDKSLQVSFETFLPHINHIKPDGLGMVVDVETRSEYGNGDQEKARYIRDRKVAVDIAKSLLVKVHGDGRSAEDKQKRIDSIRDHWGTVSWVELEQKLSLTRIKQGIQSFEAKHGLTPNVPPSDKTAEEILEGDDLPEDFGNGGTDAAA